MSNIIKQLEQEQMKQDVPSFRPGDTVEVKVWVVEGSKKRLQAFEGVEALAQGLTVNRELVNAADGTPADSEKLDKALEKNHLIITNASAYIYCPYPVLYISEGVVMGEDGYVDASQSDGVVTILMKK